MKNIAAVIWLVVIAFSLVACTNSNQPNTVNKLSTQDIEYYERLSLFEIENRDSFERYIRNYIEYANREVPEDVLKELKELTDASMIEVLIDSSFLNTIEHGSEERLDDAGSFIEDDIEGNEEYRYIYEDDRPDTVVGIYYIYSESTYVAKVTSIVGRTYLMYFKVQDGKVVDIYV